MILAQPSLRALESASEENERAAGGMADSINSEAEYSAQATAELAEG
jgi:hypothetical protein